MVVAVKSFNGNNGGPDYLSFNENDVIEVVSMDTGLQGWWTGRVLRGDNVGRLGLFPADHVRLSTVSKLEILESWLGDRSV